MSISPRIAAILSAKSLDLALEDIGCFKLSHLDLPSHLDFVLPTNLRLGHLAEKVVSELIKASSNYRILFENLQIMDEHKTIGELDMIIQEIKTKQLIHLELAYKFYLFDPSISKKKINNWIGPNRKDSLVEKLYKLKTKQFPLLYNDATNTALADIPIGEVSQSLCFLASLYIPYGYQGHFSSIYEDLIKGYYVNFDCLIDLHDSSKSYYMPLKKEWGIDPSTHKNWIGFEHFKTQVLACLKEKQAPLCWQKCGDTYQSFFVVWW